MSQSAIQQYQSVGLRGKMAEASPHQLIAMLLEGALERIANARGAIQRGDVQKKGELIGQTIAIVDNLRVSLDLENGGELSENLEALYDYLGRRLLEANINSDESILEEASGLILEVKIGWDAIPQESRNG